LATILFGAICFWAHRWNKKKVERGNLASERLKKAGAHLINSLTGLFAVANNIGERAFFAQWHTHNCGCVLARAADSRSLQTIKYVAHIESLSAGDSLL